MAQKESQMTQTIDKILKHIEAMEELLPETAKTEKKIAWLKELCPLLKEAAKLFNDSESDICTFIRDRDVWMDAYSKFQGGSK